MSVQSVAFAVGIALGALIIICACVVWLRNRAIALPGLGMTAFGVLLVGASIWSSVDIELSRQGFKARVRRLEEQVEKVVEANLVLTQAAQAAGETAAANRMQVSALAEALATGRPDRELARRVQRELQVQPRFDPRPFDESARILRSVPQVQAVEPRR